MLRHWLRDRRDAGAAAAARGSHRNFGGMRFLLDENADIRLAAFHDVATAVEDHPQRTLDRDLLAIAREEGRILITKISISVISSSANGCPMLGLSCFACSQPRLP
jgi:predicted nuclease of predicted toxin-antitoxin system